MIGIVAAAAVAGPDVQHPVRPEGQVASVVVPEWMRYEVGAARPTPSQVELRSRVGHKRAGGPAKPGDDDVAGEAREIYEESSADSGIRGEGHPQQALLTPEGDRTRQIQQVRGEHHTALHDADAPGLLDDVLNPVVRGVLDESDGQ